MSPLAENVNVSKMKPKIIFRKAKTSDMEIDKLFVLTTKKTCRFLKALVLRELARLRCPKKFGRNASTVRGFPPIATRFL